MIVTARAPTRIDLAGGTLDIWPIPCLISGSVTLNAAINLYARVTIEKRSDGKILLRSRDTGESVLVSRPVDLEKTERLKLLAALVRFYAPSCGLNITTDCAAPLGSGIAGSSALSIALNGALNTITGSGYSREKLLKISQNLEAGVLGIPTGVQDYYPALFGGLSALKFEPQGTKREAMNSRISEFQKASILCYTGKTRFSGAGNWRIFKRVMEGDREVRERLEGIKETAHRLYSAIIRGNKRGIAKAITEEWKDRKKLAGGVSHPGIERLIRAAAGRGEIAAKICGAGGGGCLYIYVLKGSLPEIRSALLRAGGRVLSFKFVKKGLRVSTVSAQTRARLKALGYLQ